jgi:hypothetical protein
MRKLMCLTAAAVSATACTPLASKDARPARSTLSCAQAVLDTRVPRLLPDDRAHCLAAGFIARYCSVSEAYLAAIGKELKDAFGPGSAEWRDWQANRRGIRCAKTSATDDELYACCGANELE